jgi:hypothetical protein
MKNSKIFAILIVLLTVSVFIGCQESKEESKKPDLSKAELYVPQKIEGLLVSDCKGLVEEIKGQYPKESDDSIYKAASDILYSDGQTEAAKLCCENVEDPALKETCLN